MKKFYILLLILFLGLPVLSKTADSKNFSISADNLFMVTLSSIQKLNYKIVEMQSTSGYILFKTPSNDEYLIMVSNNGNNTANIKISKSKQDSPLADVRNLIFAEIQNNLYNLPIEAIKWKNMPYVLLI